MVRCALLDGEIITPFAEWMRIGNRKDGIARRRLEGIVMPQTLRKKCAGGGESKVGGYVASSTSTGYRLYRLKHCRIEPSHFPRSSSHPTPRMALRGETVPGSPITSSSSQKLYTWVRSMPSREQRQSSPFIMPATYIRRTTLLPTPPAKHTLPSSLATSPRRQPCRCPQAYVLLPPRPEP